MEPFYYPLLNYKGIVLGLAYNNSITDYLKLIDAAYFKSQY